MNIIEHARRVLEIEAEAIQNLIPTIGDEFEKTVKLILACKGRVIITGMGKSGHIGSKIAATLASTGTPSFFVHPAEGIHGDLGMVTSEDIVIAISNSGETNEIINILPALKRIGAQIIAMCGRKESSLVQNADIYLEVKVDKEACPLGLAPTASTTATLAIGDALAVALLTMRNFKPEDFALYHPGGSLGRKLLLTVNEVMHTGDDLPLTSMDKTVKETLFIITAKGLGAACVVDEHNVLQGLITDGDIRRGLENKGPAFLDLTVGSLMTKTPKTITKDKLAASALHLMEKNKPRPITVLPVVDEHFHALGLLHLTDLLRQGVV